MYFTNWFGNHSWFNHNRLLTQSDLSYGPICWKLLEKDSIPRTSKDTFGDSCQNQVYLIALTNRSGAGDPLIRNLWLVVIETKFICELMHKQPHSHDGISVQSPFFSCWIYLMQNMYNDILGFFLYRMLPGTDVSCKLSKIWKVSMTTGCLPSVDMCYHEYVVWKEKYWYTFFHPISLKVM